METVSTSDSIRVLHVDDDPQFRDLVEAYLEKLDDRIAVTSKADVREALDGTDIGTVDCIVSDYQMPGMDGIDFLNAVRDDYPNLPFILFTGKGSEEVASEAINAGVTAYLQKNGTEVYELLANQIQNAVGFRRSQHKAKVTQSRLLALYEQTDGFFAVDDEWTFTYWNQQMEARTGLSSEEVVGVPFLEAFPDAAGTELYERYREAMNQQVPVEFQTHYEPHGYHVEVRAYPHEGGLFVHSRDVSTEVEDSQEIERRNHILESFANTVSHDLRNPLNVAEGRLQLAQETGDFEHLEEVAQAHNRMRNLITELLRVARGEELSSSNVSLRESAETAWQTVSSKDMELVVVDDVTFEAHESQLRRLFENLFWNALDHGDAATIRIGVLDDERGFYVEDDGSGIPTHQREEVFSTGFSTEHDSPGYGLSIVHGITDNHGWDIALVDGSEGGARFQIQAIDVVGRSEASSTDE
ncbi:sensor histidine kinase [Halogeometricum limi]|uniref:histidine kinase n=1 Tax=Halogeometricum limi TaxID=555875 RepID=A0A1I6FXA8_9EURY|nr:response regulator [Halogeometricum limi]SFR34563.1 PAS domain S-box-containing protein [Halogeometricum limi]